MDLCDTLLGGQHLPDVLPAKGGREGLLLQISV